MDRGSQNIVVHYTCRLEEGEEGSEEAQGVGKEGDERVPRVYMHMREMCTSVPFRKKRKEPPHTQDIQTA